MWLDGGGGACLGVFSFLGGGEFGQLLLLLLRGVLAEFGGKGFRGEGIDHVADTDVLEAVEVDTALHALTDFSDVVLEVLERGDLALPDLDVHRG